MLADITKILKALKTGQIRLTLHAYAQMQKRGLTEADLLSIGSTCLEAKWQEKHDTLLVIGYTIDKRGAALSCKIDDGVVVVTVMRRHLTKRERDGNQ